MEFAFKSTEGDGSRLVGATGAGKIHNYKLLNRFLRDKTLRVIL